MATGCVITSNNPPPDVAHIGATWSFHNVAGGTDTACPPGFDTASLYTQQSDSAGNPVGQCVVTSDISGTCNIDLFNCSDMAGTSAALAPANWITWIQIETHDGSGVYAKTLPLVLDVTTTDLTYNAQILNDGGYFHLAWNLVGAVSNSPLSCAQAGASGGVEAVSTVSNGSQMFVSPAMPCEDHDGYTDGLLAGSYTVSVDAMNSGMASLGTAPTLTNKVIDPQNAITELGTLSIAIDGM